MLQAVGPQEGNDCLPTVVWVANREKPLPDTSSVVLKVTKQGILALLNDKNAFIWSTNTSRSVQNPVALLLDSSDLVVKDANDGNPEKLDWQGFNIPTDTFLPIMKLGNNFQTGQEVCLSAMKNDSDPTPGEFTRHIDPTGYSQALVKCGTSVLGHSGPWNGLGWSGDCAPPPNQSSMYKVQFVFNKEETEKEQTETQRRIELPLFQLSTITRATNNFSVNNKIGEGGFGPVYKGVLEEEKEMAVKRLSDISTQGLDEFKN
ncbi:hypothetical protein HAX54_010060 [Datura stramonium]|uniref:Bulb-type lectin domain-containing protein n=1 Tax=Datura stramonium TaxID=4076 RepID=A0ABS8TGQ4_DATST|nr:hypothetical protein [Datura stramonium]